jgi:hypothetical protein
VSGAVVYRALMDLDLILQDMADMGPIYAFLSTVDDDSPALLKLHAEILTFTTRLRSLADAVKKL